jgi:hypothetical protein
MMQTEVERGTSWSEDLLGKIPKISEKNIPSEAVALAF